MYSSDRLCTVQDYDEYRHDPTSAAVLGYDEYMLWIGMAHTAESASYRACVQEDHLMAT